MPTFKLYMAPLKGFTDYLFRNSYAAHFPGFDLAVAPFIPTKQDNKIKKKYVADVLPEKNPCLPVVPQILSKSAGDFTVLANYLFDLGQPTVNWNLGCPYPMVANKKRGSGMLPHTDMIEAFLDAVIPGIKGGLSVKIRLGWQTADEAFRLIPVLNRYPLVEVIIHPRTGLQRYDGQTDLAAFEHCLALSRHPVVYNGDIRTAEVFNILSRRFEAVNRWMIGRWCIADPFLPLTIKAGNGGSGDKIQRMQRFHDDLLEKYCSVLDGPGHVLNKMKGLWKYFALPLENSAAALRKIRKATTTDQYRDRVDRFFECEAMLK